MYKVLSGGVCGIVDFDKVFICGESKLHKYVVACICIYIGF